MNKTKLINVVPSKREIKHGKLTSEHLFSKDFNGVIDYVGSFPMLLNEFSPIDVYAFSTKETPDHLTACCEQPCTGWESGCGRSTNKHD